MNTGDRVHITFKNAEGKTCKRIVRIPGKVVAVDVLPGIDPAPDPRQLTLGEEPHD